MKQINSLSIAGTDPTSGAGIQADLKTFSALKVYGCSVITTLLAQNTCGVQSIFYIEPDFIVKQIESVLSDIKIDSVKIGMLAKSDVIEAVSEQLKRYQIKNVVLDTVMVAKSGDLLITPSAIETLRIKLIPQVDIITPNLLESASILNAPVAVNEHDIKEQGRALLALGANTVLIKGGHLQCNESPDWIFNIEGVKRLNARRINTKNNHGTGCTFSAALAALRPSLSNWIETAIQAKSWLNNALEKADKLKIGHGNGPVHHFYTWW